MLMEFLDNLFYFYKCSDEIITRFDVKNDDLIEIPSIKQKLFSIREKFIHNEFIEYCDLDYIQSSYDLMNTILLFLETRYLEYEPLYNNLVEYNAICFKFYDYFEYYNGKYLQLNESYLEFIKWACKREPLVFPYNYFFYTESYKIAKDDYAKLAYYLQGMPTMRESYFYNLALHNIVCSPDTKNDLFTKYKINLNAIGFANSVSDSVSSVSLNVPNWINEASLADSILTQTPYGIEVLKIRSQLNNVVVCV